MQTEHEHKSAKNGQNAGKDLGKTLQQPGGELIDVVGHPADKISPGRIINRGKRQCADLVKERTAQMLDRSIGNGMVHKVISHPNSALPIAAAVS